MGRTVQTQSLQNEQNLEKMLRKPTSSKIVQGIAAVATGILATNCNVKINPQEVPYDPIELKDIPTQTVYENELVTITPESRNGYGAHTYTFEQPLDENGEWTPDFLAGGEDQEIYEINVTATDAKKNTATKTATIIVKDFNRPVTIHPIQNIETDEGEKITIEIGWDDEDTDNEHIFDISPHFEQDTQQPNKFTWTPSYTQSGYYDITAEVNDQRGSTDKTIFQVIVNDVNGIGPIEITKIDPQQPKEKQEITLEMIITDPDKDDITEVKITPTGIFELDSLTRINEHDYKAIFKGEFPYTATNDPAEQKQFTITAKDELGAEIQKPFDITVRDSKIVMEIFDGTQSNLYLINPDGTDLTKITNTNHNEKQPVFRKTGFGDKIFHVSDQNGQTEIYKLTLPNLITTKITNHPGAKNPKTNPVTDELYFEYLTNIFSIQFNGTNPDNLTNSLYSFLLDDISPDGTKLLTSTKIFSGTRYGLGELTISSKQLRKLAGDGSASTRHEWKGNYHPTERKATFQSNARGPPYDIYSVYVIDLSNFNTGTVSNEFPNDAILPVYSENGSYFFYLCQNNIKRVNTPWGANKTQITTTSDIVEQHIKPIPGGILYTRNHGNKIDLWYIDNNGENKKRITDLPDGHEVRNIDFK